MSQAPRPPDPPNGVFVLGMHRSGTSVVAGLLDRMGLDAGPRQSMLSADQFNSDGYWEQRPVVDWHDSILSRLHGWASAPPEPPDHGAVEHLASGLGDSATAMLTTLYRSSWFMKDPRQCLLLQLWSRLRGDSELAIVVSRNPADVIRSLQRRNGYSEALAAALWERYCRDLLIGLQGRPCLFIRYEQLTADPEPTVAELAQVLDRHVGRATSHAEKTADAVALVRSPRVPASPEACQLSQEQLLLHRLFVDLSGYHERFERPVAIPPLTEGSAVVLERRRSRLNRVGRLLRSSSSMRAKLDRIPTLLRRYARRTGE